MIDQEPSRKEMIFLHAGARDELVFAALLHDLGGGRMVEAEHGRRRRTWHDRYCA